MSSSLNLPNHFSFIEKYPHYQWKNQGFEISQKEGNPILAWSVQTNQSLQDIETLAIQQLAQTFEDAKLSVFEFKQCLKNLCLITRKVQYCSPDSFGRLSSLSQKALLDVETAISLLPKDPEYQKEFLDIQVDGGDCIPLRRRGEKAFIVPKVVDEMVLGQVSLKHLSKEQSISLIHFLETGFLSSNHIDVRAIVVELEVFYQAIQKSKCNCLSDMFLLRLGEMVNNIKSSSQLFCFLELAQSCSFGSLEKLCLSVCFDLEYKELSLDQQKKLCAALVIKYPEIAEVLIYFLENRKLPNACLQPSKPALQLLMKMQDFAKALHLAFLMKICDIQIASSFQSSDHPVEFGLMFLETFPSASEELKTKAIQIVLQRGDVNLSSHQQKQIDSILLARHPQIGRQLIDYLSAGKIILPYSIVQQKDSIFLELLVCAAFYDLTSLMNGIQNALIDEADGSLDSLLKLIRFEKKYQMRLSTCSIPTENFPLMLIRSYFLTQLTVDKIRKEREADPKIAEKLVSIIDEAWSRFDLELNDLFLKIAEAKNFSILKNICMKNLNLLSIF